MYAENDKKFVFVINEKAGIGRSLNAYGHTAIGLVGLIEKCHAIGDIALLEYRQAGGAPPALLSTYPVIVLRARNGSQLRRLRDEAAEAGLPVNYFTDVMNGDSAASQLEATRTTPIEQQEFILVGLFGPSDVLAPLTKRFSLMNGFNEVPAAPSQPPAQETIAAVEQRPYSGGAARNTLGTKAVHAGSPASRIGGAATVPIFQSTVFEYKEISDYHDIEYPRFNNLPNQIAVARKIAALEGGEDAIVTSSGMAAITTTLLTVLCKGGHCLVQECVYGGTHNFLTRDAGDFGITFDFIDVNRPETWAAKLRPNTRAIYVETLSNPLLQVADHPAVVEFAKAHGLLSIIDNTFATPVNFRPVEIGFDISLHSATKYLNGHSDLVAGAVVGRYALISNVRHRLNHLGGCLDPHACFLLERGLKTLVVRVLQQSESAFALAQFLAAQPQVARVNYPGLPSHPQHQLARKLFDQFGGMLSFELAGGAPAAEVLVKSVRLPIHAASLGGVETLVTRPATTSHSGISPEERARLGITDGLIRCSVGLETVEELIEDFTRVFRHNL